MRIRVAPDEVAGAGRRAGAGRGRRGLVTRRAPARRPGWLDGPRRSRPGGGAQPGARRGRGLRLADRGRDDARGAVPRAHRVTRTPDDAAGPGPTRRRAAGDRVAVMRLLGANLRKLVGRPATWVTLVLLLALLGADRSSVADRGAPDLGGARGGPRAPGCSLTFPGAYELMLTMILGDRRAAGRRPTARRSAAPSGAGARSRPPSPAARAGVRYTLAQLRGGRGLHVDRAAAARSSSASWSRRWARRSSASSLDGMADPRRRCSGCPELFGRAGLALAMNAALGYAIATVARSQLAGIVVGIGLYFAEGIAGVFAPGVQVVPVLGLVRGRRRPRAAAGGRGRRRARRDPARPEHGDRRRDGVAGRGAGRWRPCSPSGRRSPARVTRHSRAVVGAASAGRGSSAGAVERCPVQPAGTGAGWNAGRPARRSPASEWNAGRSDRRRCAPAGTPGDPGPGDAGRSRGGRPGQDPRPRRDERAAQRRAIGASTAVVSRTRSPPRARSPGRAGRPRRGSSASAAADASSDRRQRPPRPERRDPAQHVARRPLRLGRRRDRRLAPVRARPRRALRSTSASAGTTASAEPPVDRDDDRLEHASRVEPERLDRLERVAATARRGGSSGRRAHIHAPYARCPRAAPTSIARVPWAPMSAFSRMLRPVRRSPPPPQLARAPRRTTTHDTRGRRPTRPAPGEPRHTLRFEELGLSADLLRTVADEGYTEPTPVQERAIPLVLAGPRRPRRRPDRHRQDGGVHAADPRPPEGATRTPRSRRPATRSAASC